MSFLKEHCTAAILLPIFAVIAIGCSTTEDSNSEIVDTRTVEEINAERGDPCECIETKTVELDKLLASIEEHNTSDKLKEAIASMMDGCMTTLGHVEADLAWSKSLTACESFGPLRDALIDVRNRVKILKESEQQEFVEDHGEGASEVLNNLQKSAY